MSLRTIRRMRYWLHQSERDRQLREELEIHVDMRAQELMEDRIPEADARSQAMREFGSILRTQEDARGTWIGRWLNDLTQDFGYALRTLRKQPGFAAVAVLSASLGIGACSTIFGFANYALFHPLPVHESTRLVSISGRSLKKVGTSVTWPDFEDVRKAQSLQESAAYFPFVPATISRSGDPQRHWGSLVTANYFDIVRPEFAIGRGFHAGVDDRPGESPVVVLSHSPTVAIALCGRPEHRGPDG
jgi:hypothetical protein